MVLSNFFETTRESSISHKVALTSPRPEDLFVSGRFLWENEHASVSTVDQRIASWAMRVTASGRTVTLVKDVRLRRSLKRTFAVDNMEIDCCKEFAGSKSDVTLLRSEVKDSCNLLRGG